MDEGGVQFPWQYQRRKNARGAEFHDEEDGNGKLRAAESEGDGARTEGTSLTADSHDNGVNTSRPANEGTPFLCRYEACGVWLPSVAAYESHYNRLHRNVCSQCGTIMPSFRLLDLHIQEEHDTLFKIRAEKEDMYECLVEGCGVRSRTRKTRSLHLADAHKYPANFTLFSLCYKRPHRKPHATAGPTEKPVGRPGGLLADRGSLSAKNSLGGVAGQNDMEVDELTETLKNIKIPSEVTFGGHSHTPKFRPRNMKPAGSHTKSGRGGTPKQAPRPTNVQGCDQKNGANARDMEA